MQGCTKKINERVGAVLARVNLFDAERDEGLSVSLLRSGAMVVCQLLHTDFSPGDVKPGRPQRSIMIVLVNNTHIMLADGTAVVAHR